MKMGLFALVVLASASLAGGVYADEFPQGCVDCHVQTTGQTDFRLNVLLDQIGHKRLRGVRSAPKDCKRCHDDESDPTLSELIHVIHYDVPKANMFVQRNGGDCRHCHTMQAEEGEAVAKNGPKNW